MRMFLTCVPVRLSKFSFKKGGQAAAAEATGLLGVSSVSQTCGWKLAYRRGFCLTGAERSAAAGGQTVYCSFTSLGEIRWWFPLCISSHSFPFLGKT